MVFFVGEDCEGDETTVLVLLEGGPFREGGLAEGGGDWVGEDESYVALAGEVEGGSIKGGRTGWIFLSSGLSGFGAFGSFPCSFGSGGLRWLCGWLNCWWCGRLR